MHNRKIQKSKTFFWTIINSQEYEEWLNKLKKNDKIMHGRVLARIAKIEEENHFGDIKAINEIHELRWTNDTRIYIAMIDLDKILLTLGGGNKNGQSKDIEKAKKIYRRYKEIINS